MDLIKRKQNNILLHRVNLGEKTVSIPVVQLGDEGEKSILITGGVDGDEYAGIEAAYALVEYFTKTKPTEKIVIIPIVNIPGFQNGTSWNPYDGKYPKHIFPGREKGTSSERLMYWLSENFVKDVDLWIDLHSGASTEALQAYVGAYETKQKKVNQLLRESLQKVKADVINFDQYAPSFAENIAKKKVVRIILESGQLGERDKKAIQQHVLWVKQLVNTKQQSKKGKKEVWRNVREFLATKEGIWVSAYTGKTVKKGVLLGEVRSLDGKILDKVIAKESGVFLWRREAMHCKKGDSLYAYGYNKERYTF